MPIPRKVAAAPVKTNRALLRVIPGNSDILLQTQCSKVQGKGRRAWDRPDNGKWLLASYSGKTTGTGIGSVIDQILKLHLQRIVSKYRSP